MPSHYSPLSPLVPPVPILRAYLEGYGQVYLRAWKAASGVYRQVIGKVEGGSSSPALKLTAVSHGER